jgi:hypothetical protein
MRGDLLTEPSHEAELRAMLVGITAAYDDEAGQVNVRAEVETSAPTIKLAIRYDVSILAELPIL